ncbi:hypothetical protein DZ899_07285 [Pseudomonas aeruginosa]|nr:hypothetical protein DZ899_07285 [Pseudomonas aeruginosa]PBV15455.1 hypothetical protein CJU34_04890 [Pseudomonas aeruginosa]RPS32352.1 hypothetical protein IPC1018_10095 [Pseudomonas aeruginosa]RQF19368.1 hypothetical protein IPC279_11700 [Pseudomonas aeruginosa]RUC47873.1 hypothetical protein IPC1409_14830 [Pseudomonas aeruginosa]
MSTTSTARPWTPSPRRFLLACSLAALSACGTTPPEHCPRPQIPAELLRKAPKPSPLSSSMQASAAPSSWNTTSATPSSAATPPRSSTP